MLQSDLTPTAVARRRRSGRSTRHEDCLPLLQSLLSIGSVFYAQVYSNFLRPVLLRLFVILSPHITERTCLQVDLHVNATERPAVGVLGSKPSGKRSCWSRKDEILLEFFIFPRSVEDPKTARFLPRERREEQRRPHCNSHSANRSQRPRKCEGIGSRETYIGRGCTREVTWMRSDQKEGSVGRTA